MGLFDKLRGNKKPKENKKTSKVDNNVSKVDDKPSNVYKGYDLSASQDDKINMVNKISDESLLVEIFEREPNSTVRGLIIVKIKEDKNLASLFYLRKPNQRDSDSNKIISKVSDELILTEMLCYTEIEYGLHDYYQKLNPDLLMLVGDFAPNSMNRSAASKVRSEMVGKEAPFDENVIIDAINHFNNKQSLINVKDRAHSRCPPFSKIDDNAIYDKIEKTAEERINQI